MTRHGNRADQPQWMAGSRQKTEDPEIGQPSLERTRAANEVGSAIVHQLNGPLTALRLYVGEIRQNIGRFRESAEGQDSMQQMVEGAFQETERICAMMRLIADTFEGPLYPENAAALGRDVITWWSRSANANGRDSEQTVSVHDLLPRGSGRPWAISARAAPTSKAPSGCKSARGRLKAIAPGSCGNSGPKMEPIWFVSRSAKLRRRRDLAVRDRLARLPA